MLIRKAQATYLLYSPRRLYFPSEGRPSFQPWSAITPRSRRTSWAAGRPGKSGTMGGISALGARPLPPFPARMSARSRAEQVETYPVGYRKPPVESRKGGPRGRAVFHARCARACTTRSASFSATAPGEAHRQSIQRRTSSDM